MADKPRWVDLDGQICPECGGEMQVYTKQEEGEMLDHGDPIRCKDCTVIGMHSHEADADEPLSPMRMKISHDDPLPGAPPKEEHDYSDTKSPVARVKMPLPPHIYDKYVEEMEPGYKISVDLQHPQTGPVTLEMEVMIVHDENHFFAMDLNTPFSYEVELIRGKEKH